MGCGAGCGFHYTTRDPYNLLSPASGERENETGRVLVQIKPRQTGSEANVREKDDSAHQNFANSSVAELRSELQHLGVECRYVFDKSELLALLAAPTSMDAVCSPGHGRVSSTACRDVENVTRKLAPPTPPVEKNVEHSVNASQSVNRSANVSRKPTPFLFEEHPDHAVEASSSMKLEVPGKSDDSTTVQQGEFATKNNSTGKSGIDVRMVGGLFQIGKKIGCGAFAEVYMGTHIHSKTSVAIKLEPLACKCPMLQNEWKLYKMLQGGIGVPEMMWYGVGGDYTVLVMDLLGSSLEDQFNLCKQKFTVRTVLMLANQMLERVQYIHASGIVHRDIKPDNFLLGLGRRSKEVFIVDLGLSYPFRNPKTGVHVSFADGRKLSGTARYASINNHLGIEQSRRDDLESLAYVLLYFARGSLPWQGFTATDTTERNRLIMERKRCTALENLCKNMPPEFIDFIKHCRSLRFEESPDYAYLRNLLKDASSQEGCTSDSKYDWTS